MDGWSVCVVTVCVAATTIMATIDTRNNNQSASIDRSKKVVGVKAELALSVGFYLFSNVVCRTVCLSHLYRSLAWKKRYPGSWLIVCGVVWCGVSVVSYY